ncbi:50S ribosomal protein L23, partial [Patescibacteria group bacterium]
LNSMGFFNKDKKEEEKPVKKVKKVVTKKTKAAPKKAEKKTEATVKRAIGSEKFFDVLLAPQITEKTHDLISSGKYVFKVHANSDKKTVKKSVEMIYGVIVEDVNIINIKSKKRRFGKTIGKKAGFKKAIVTLKKGDKIEFFQEA